MGELTRGKATPRSEDMLSVLCLSYVLRGNCNKECRQAATHRALMTTEVASVKDFLNQALKLGLRQPGETGWGCMPPQPPSQTYLPPRMSLLHYTTTTATMGPGPTTMTSEQEERQGSIGSSKRAAPNLQTRKDTKKYNENVRPQRLHA